MTKKKKPSPQKILRQILLVLMTIFAAVAAVIFLLPTVLTINVTDGDKCKLWRCL